MITGSIVGCAYITELFIAWYSGVEYEQYAFLNRATGPYWWAYWAMMTCNVFSPQFMWFKKLRTSIMFSFVISIVVNIGMWFERFVIIVTSLHRDYLPSSWTMFSPTFVDIGIFFKEHILIFSSCLVIQPCMIRNCIYIIYLASFNSLLCSIHHSIPHLDQKELLYL